MLPSLRLWGGECPLPWDPSCLLRGKLACPSKNQWWLLLLPWKCNFPHWPVVGLENLMLQSRILESGMPLESIALYNVTLEERVPQQVICPRLHSWAVTGQGLALSPAKSCLVLLPSGRLSCDFGPLASMLKWNGTWLITLANSSLSERRLKELKIVSEAGERFERRVEVQRGETDMALAQSEPAWPCTKANFSPFPRSCPELIECFSFDCPYSQSIFYSNVCFKGSTSGFSTFQNFQWREEP